jgi:hypothetical protein
LSYTGIRYAGRKLTYMSTAIVFLLLLGFSICMVVGLVTVLQSLVNEPPEPVNELPSSVILPDSSAER